MEKFNIKNIKLGDVYNKEIEQVVKYRLLAVDLVGLIFLIFFLLYFFKNWDIGFIDPSTSFAESLIYLYNFIWVFLILILFIVLILMGRILYLFSWNFFFVKNKVINNIYILFITLFLSLSLFLENNKLIYVNLKKLNRLSWIDLKNFNIWYLNYSKNEFLLISDLSEYKQLELIWCILPAIILCLIAGPSFSLIFSLDSAVNPEVNIKVIGKQWFWVYSFDNLVYDKNNDDYISTNFSYDSVMIEEKDLKKGAHRLLEVDNRLMIPFGVPVRFLITSTDVLHSWAVPSLGLKVDAIPGRINQFIVEIKKPGVYYGQCSELCGPMHGFMPIILQVVNFDDYKDFLKNIK